MSLSPARTVQQSPECVTADVNDEAIIMSMESGRYIALDPVGRDIWRLIAEPKRIAELCALLAADYAAPAATVEADVIEFLDMMIDAGAVRVLD